MRVVKKLAVHGLNLSLVAENADNGDAIIDPAGIGLHLVNLGLMLGAPLGGGVG